jgi:hypothetical protein
VITSLNEISLTDDSCGMESPSSTDRDDDASLRKRSLQYDSLLKGSETLSKDSNLENLHDTDTEMSQHNGDVTNLSGPRSGFHQFGGV